MDNAEQNTQNKTRPLSPHLQIYKPQLTSVMSIMHRATGAALAVGTLMIVWMLAAAACGPESFAHFTWFIGTPAGIFLLAGWSWALSYHLLNGIRHLFWDMGYLFKLENAYRAGYTVLVLSFVLTGLIWFCA